MEEELLNKYRKLWDEWEVRGCILFSLSLQIFLIFSAAFRKQKTKMAKIFRPIIWLAYLTADAVAMFALGLLSRSIDPSKNNFIKSLSPATSHSYNDLLAFWAPFLLLHLGGPDTITAFALEDNELWLRHLIWLCVEVTVAGYVFVISLPNNGLLLPTLLVFVSGIIRYVERTWALYLGSNDGFKGFIPEKNPKNEGYYSKRSAAFVKHYITNRRTESGHEKMVAYELFQTFEFKYLIADLILPSGYHGIQASCQFFLKQEHEEAFRIMDVELGFAYDILYTKARVVHMTIGYVTRAICFICVLVSFLLFWFLPKNGIKRCDVKITYALLGGAMVLDVVALINLIFSDWTFVFLLHKHPWLSGLRSFIHTITTYHRRLELKYVSQYNLISSSCTKHERSYGKKILQKLSQSRLAKKILDNFFHTYDLKVADELKEFIFEELKKKAKKVEELKEKAKKKVKKSKEKAKKKVKKSKENAKEVEELKEKAKKKVKKSKENAKEVEELKEKAKKEVEELEEKAKKAEKAEKVEELEEESKNKIKKVEDLKKKAKKAATNVMEESKKLWSYGSRLTFKRYKSLKWTVDEADFVESILLWHIATHGCYHKDINETQGRVSVERQVSKVISEYMVYLLVVHPSMISSIEGVKQIKLRDACEGLNSSPTRFGDKVNRIYDRASRAPQPDLVRTHRLFADACTLIEILAYMDVTSRWQAISEVWVELLAHGASQCRANYHAKCLSRGGELLTYVWFLMAQLGSGQHYYEHT